MTITRLEDTNITPNPILAGNALDALCVERYGLTLSQNDFEWRRLVALIESRPDGGILLGEYRSLLSEDPTTQAAAYSPQQFIDHLLSLSLVKLWGTDGDSRWMELNLPGRSPRDESRLITSEEA